MDLGLESFGQLGHANNNNCNIPIQVNSLSGVIAISGGWNHSLVLKNNGTVMSCGDNGNGQLGTGNNFDSNFPIPVITLTNVISIGAGGYHSMVLKMMVLFIHGVQILLDNWVMETRQIVMFLF